MKADAVLAWAPDPGGLPRAVYVRLLAAELRRLRAGARSGARLALAAGPWAHWAAVALEEAGWTIETAVAHLRPTETPAGGDGQDVPVAPVPAAMEYWWLARTGGCEPLQIDAARVTAGGPSPSIQTRATAARAGKAPGTTSPSGWHKADDLADYIAPRAGELLGRYPPNLLLSHRPGCKPGGETEVRAGSHPGGGTGGIWKRAGASDGQPCAPGYGDERGLERVAVWDCEPGCPVASVTAASAPGGPPVPTLPPAEDPAAPGRWPPNLVLIHDAGCVYQGPARVPATSPASFRSTGAAQRRTMNSAEDGALHAARTFRGYAGADGNETVDAWDCAPGCPVATVAVASGECPGAVSNSRAKGTGAMFDPGAHPVRPGPADTGTAARFYPQFHPADGPAGAWEWFARLLAPPGALLVLHRAPAGLDARLTGRWTLRTP